MGSIHSRSLFFSRSLSFLSFFFSLFCSSFFPSSNFFLPISPCLPPFFLSRILFLSFVLLVSFFSSPFCCFSFSLFSHYFILLISSSFTPPLSFTLFFVFVFSFSPLNFFLVSTLCQGGYEHDG